jgi:putative hydrolases of HD superfamily
MGQHTSKLPKVPPPWQVRKVLNKMSYTPPENTSSPISFFHYLERLKIEKREGWRRFDVQHGESIADHMYRMSLMTMLAPPALTSKLDVPRCTKMALVHDMAEGLVGDLTPVDNVPKPEKSRREAETMDWVANSLLGKVHGGIPGKDLRAAWQEYEDSVTPESLFVHDIDKIELILQMVEYERVSNCETDLSEFSHVATRISLPEMKAWAQEILDERTELWKSHGRKPRDPMEAKLLKEQQDEYYGNGQAKTLGNGVSKRVVNGDGN